MLTRLTVANLAVIEGAELAPGAGFSVLTGETGAGKSLLVDALGLVLGDRGSGSLVRQGTDRASVTAEFSLPAAAPAREALAERGLPVDDVLLLHRQIGADGRSRAWINGVAVPLAALRELAEALVAIHGQQDHLALARPPDQRRALDAWSGAEELAAAVAAAAAAVRDAEATLASARAGLDNRDKRLEFLRFQLGELDELAPRENEYAELLAEYERLHRREQTAAALAAALEALEDGERGALSGLAAARQALARLPTGAVDAAADLVAQAQVLAGDAARLVRSDAEAEDDPDRLDWLNGRIARYQALARKHHEEPARLAELRCRLADEAEALESGELQLEKLEREAELRRNAWRRAAAELSRRRAESAPGLATGVTDALQELGMPGARFEVRLEAEHDGFGAGGQERVRFEVSANAGQAPGPVGRVASGGELSRLLLAVEVLAGSANGVPVMVFDEIDAGVSGRVAELVGRRLRALSARCQVLCVTHLPQVAALAAHHYAVRKAERSGESAVTVHRIEGEQRVEALAEMLAGVRVTASARTHARELIARARKAPA